MKVYGNRMNLDEMGCLIKAHFNNIGCVSVGVDDNVYLFVTEEAMAKDVKDFVVAKTGLNSRAFKPW